MIHHSGTFEYQAEFTADSFRNDDVVVNGSSINQFDGDRLVGNTPMIRFWKDRLVLVASQRRGATLRNASFPIGDAVSLAARSGDKLHVLRTGRGGVGLSLVRDEHLVLALGAVTVVPLGKEMQVFERPTRKNPFENWTSDSWLEFHVGSEQLALKERGITNIGNYQIYLELCWQYGIPGNDAYVSISVSNNSAINLASIRSAILLANGDLKMTRWNDTEGFRPIAGHGEYF